MFVIRAALYSYPSAINTSELLLPSSVELMTLKGLSAWNSLISLHSFWHVNPQSFWRHSGHHIPRQSHSDRIIHNGEAISYSSCLLQICKGGMWARNLALSPELSADGIGRKLSSHGVIFSSSSVFIQLSSMLQIIFQLWNKYKRQQCHYSVQISWRFVLIWQCQCHQIDDLTEC